MQGWLTVVVGTIGAFLRSIRAVFSTSADGHLFRDAYVQYGRWLVAGLTSQVAADIVLSQG